MHCSTHICHIFVLSVFLILHSCMCSKYSKESNLKNDDDRNIDYRNEEDPFNMKKCNLLWSKGRTVLPLSKLAGLYADLKVHDKYEAHLKKMRTQDMDLDGEMEAKVLTNYRKIVEYYGLESRPPNNVYMSNEIPLENTELKDINFQDSKLQNMWKKAEEAGFSDPDENTVELEQGKLNVSPKEASEKKEALKKNKRSIKEGYMNLEHLVSSMPAAEPKFRDSRVHKLWAMAQKTNWTEEQLNGFKEELLHFEHRLSKHSYYQQQLDLSLENLGELGEGEDVPDSHKHLEEKSKSLGQKIKKFHRNFKSRLDDALQHSEL